MQNSVTDLLGENPHIFMNDFRVENLIWVQFFFIEIKNNIKCYELLVKNVDNFRNE